MMPAPLVTVGIPVHNGAATLTAAIASVFAQTFADWELLLVNDGSSDVSLDLIRSVDDPRVRVIDDGRQLGLPARLNQIAALAQGRLLARMDADDVMHPQRLARQVEWMASHPGDDVIGTHAFIIDREGVVTGMRAPRLPRDHASLLDRGLFLHPTVMMRAEWARAHPYDASADRAEDMELWSRTWPNTTFGMVPEALLFYREALPVRVPGILRGQRTHRRVIRRDGPACAGLLATARLLSISLIRSVLYATIGRTPWSDLLYRRRNTPLPGAVRHEAERALRDALATPVPGIGPALTPVGG